MQKVGRVHTASGILIGSAVSAGLTYVTRHTRTHHAGPDLRGGAGLPPTEGLPPFIFYFSLMIDAYETTT